MVPSFLGHKFSIKGECKVLFLALADISCSTTGENKCIMKITKKSLLGMSGLMVGVLSNVTVIIASEPLLRVPRGTPVRPMGLTFLYFNVALFALTGLPLSFAARRAGARNSTFSILLCLLPLPVGMATLWLFVSLAGLLMEQ